MSNLPVLRMDNMDVMQLGDVLARSGYYADVKQAAQAVVKILRGQELGIGPATAMSEISIVQGKPVLSAALMGSLIKRSGRYTYRVREHNDSVCVIEFFEAGERLGVSEFTLADAKSAGLADKAIWKQYPRNMLFARAMSNGAKWFTPDIFGGAVYTAEELQGASAAPLNLDTATGEILDPPVTPHADATGRRTPAALPAQGTARDEPAQPDPEVEIQKLRAAEGALRDYLEIAGSKGVTPRILDAPADSDLARLLAKNFLPSAIISGDIDLSHLSRREINAAGRLLKETLAALETPDEAPPAEPVEDADVPAQMAGA